MKTRMQTFHVKCVAMVVTALVCATAVLQAAEPQSPLGLHKVLLREDKITGDKVFGWAVAHRAYDVELPEGIVQLSILSVLSEGVHADIESRAADIAERLTIAWYLMARGGDLFVASDNRPELFMASPGKKLKFEKCPAIYVKSNYIDFPFRVMTVYPEDVALYGRGIQKGPERVAEFLKAEIESHFLLFWQRSLDIGAYEQLALDKTREGKIFKEVFLRTKEYVTTLGVDKVEVAHLRDSLARIEVNQRHRMHLLSNVIPRDW